MIAINKTDLFDSVPVHKIKTKLELEINKLIRHEIENVEKLRALTIMITIMVIRIAMVVVVIVPMVITVMALTVKV